MTSSPFSRSRIARTFRPRIGTSKDVTSALAATSSGLLDVGSVPGVPGAAYLKIEDIRGESERPGREGSIDVEAIAWGVVFPSATQRARAQPQPLELVVRSSEASVRLWDAAASGRRIADPVLTLTRFDESGQEVDFLIITLEAANVDSYRVATGSVTGGLLDVVALRYGTATYEHVDTATAAQRDFTGSA